MVERRISKRRYLVAGLITILIFSLGMSLGLVWDSKRVEWVQKENQLRDLDYQSLQFQYLYLSTLKSNKSETCSVLYTTLEQSVKDLGQTLDALIAYQKESSINDEQYKIVERDYVLDNFRYWLFAKQVQEACDKDNVTILYFYTKYACSECSDQGTLLTHYKKIFDDRLLIFPIDTELKKDEISISMIEARYNITKYPSIVIKDKKYEGLIESGQLHNLICSSFKNFQPECK
ncbi:hypothetical protein KY312_02780 [Candidatus Woesearchaeota archaeon]|nr:hypothetical protein [Candidatus Woesearchaeota archaeon]